MINVMYTGKNDKYRKVIMGKEQYRTGAKIPLRNRRDYVEKANLFIVVFMRDV